MCDMKCGKLSSWRQKRYTSSGDLLMRTAWRTSRALDLRDEAFVDESSELICCAQITSRAVTPSTAAVAAVSFPFSFQSDDIADPSVARSSRSPPTRPHSQPAGLG